LRELWPVCLLARQPDNQADGPPRPPVEADEMVEMYRLQRERAIHYNRQLLLARVEALRPDPVIEPEGGPEPDVEEMWLRYGRQCLLAIEEQGIRSNLILQEEREFDGIFVHAASAFGRIADRERAAVRRERKGRKFRVEQVDAPILLREFFDGVEDCNDRRDFEFVQQEVRSLSLNAWLPRIGAYVGANPIFDVDGAGVGLVGDSCYRWVDPSAKSEMACEGRSAALPPCAVPYFHSFGWVRRAYVRRALGPVWWETSVVAIKPRPGDVLVSRVADGLSVDPRYFSNGDWDLSRVQNIQCGRRKHRLSELYVHEAGEHRWQVRAIMPDCQTVAYSISLDPLIKGLLRKELDTPRPVFVPLGKTWEMSIMSLTAPTTDAAIRMRYDAVIKAAEEQHVAALRLHMGAALKEHDRDSNPVAVYRMLLEQEALLKVQTGVQPHYGPK